MPFVENTDGSHRQYPMLVKDTVDMDRLIEFLTEFNEFINQEPKPFRPMSDREMKL